MGRRLQPVTRVVTLQSRGRISMENMNAVEDIRSRKSNGGNAHGISENGGHAPEKT